MFRLTDERPIEREYTFDGRSFFIKRDFKTALRVVEALQDDDLNDLDKVGVTLAFFSDIDDFLDVDYLYYMTDDEIKAMADLVNELLTEVFGDLEANVEYDLAGNPMPTVKKDASYDFTHDAEYIFSSFVQAYDIDLLSADMTWLEFKALFQGLPDDTIMKKIIDIRVRKLPTGKGTGKERKALIEAKRAYALPGTEYADDREEEDDGGW